MITIEQCYAMLLLNEQEMRIELAKELVNVNVIIGLNRHRIDVLSELVRLLGDKIVQKSA